MTTQNIADLAETSRRVADQHADLEAAGAEFRAEKAALLRQVLDAVRPAARAISSAVGIGMTAGTTANAVVPASWRGLYLAGQGPTLVDRVPVPQPETKRASWPERGRHAGTRLLLRADGALVELSYAGPWSSVPGEVSRWEATAREVTPDDAVTRYRVEDILDAIGIAMHAQASNRPRIKARAAEMRSNAAVIRALAVLTRGLR